MIFSNSDFQYIFDICCCFDARYGSRGVVSCSLSLVCWFYEAVSFLGGVTSKGTLKELVSFVLLLTIFLHNGSPHLQGIRQFDNYFWILQFVTFSNDDEVEACDMMTAGSYRLLLGKDISRIQLEKTYTGHTLIRTVEFVIESSFILVCALLAGRQENVYLINKNRTDVSSFSPLSSPRYRNSLNT